MRVKSSNNSSEDAQFVVEGEKAEKQLIKEMEKEWRAQPLEKLKFNKHDEEQKEVEQDEDQVDDEQEEEESDEEKENE